MAAEKRLVTKSKLTAIGDALRAHTSETGDIKLHEMPARIAALLPKGSREVWLHANQQQTGLTIDTGIAADMEHTLEVVCYGNIYSTSTPFGSYTSNASRQILNLLTSSNKIRFAWGNSGLKEYVHEITEFSMWRPMVVRFNKSGFTINGFNNAYSAKTLTGTYSATGGASTANYRIFGNVSSGTDGQPGFFRSAKIFDGSNNLIHHLVPVMHNDWTLALLDKVTGTEMALPSGANGFEGFWAPHTDARVGLTE